MEKVYKNISWLFAAILGIVILGFFKTYFGLFPTFEKVTSIQHIHGTLFLLWFVMLIVQPILIQKRKLEWHRRIGMISYFLVPLIIVYDRMYGKAYKPYVVSLSILLLSQVGFYFFRNTEFWQVVCGKFVHLFYG